MFDEVTKQEGGRRAARKGAYVAGSTLLQVLIVLGVVFVGDQLRAAATSSEPIVDVKFIRAPPPPPPPPAAPRRKTPPKPRTEAPKPPPSPMAMIQPKEVQPEMKMPDPSEPKEEEPDSGDEGEGGVVGGVVGAGAIEEAPQYLMAGFRKPSQAVSNCIQSNVRIPQGLQGFISGPITVKFAVGRDGSVGLFQVVGQIPDKRIGDAIWQAIQSCTFIPGADAQGRPTRIWVVMPIRFVGG